MCCVHLHLQTPRLYFVEPSFNATIGASLLGYACTSLAHMMTEGLGSKVQNSSS